MPGRYEAANCCQKSDLPLRPPQAAPADSKSPQKQRFYLPLASGRTFYKTIRGCLGWVSGGSSHTGGTTGAPKSLYIYIYITERASFIPFHTRMLFKSGGLISTHSDQKWTPSLDESPPLRHANLGLFTWA